MSEWKTYRLGDICQVLNGRAYKQEELLNQGPYPVLRVGNILQGNNWYYSDLELPDDKYCYNGDLLYAWSCGFAPYIWKGKKSIYHYHIWKLKENTQIIDKLFFYYYLIIHTKYNLGGTHGSVMLHLTKKDFENQTLHLPPLDEQRRIAGILGSLDDKIELNRRINANLEAQAQALFRSWFVDFEPFRDGPFVDSELGKIPQGWEIGTLSEIADITMGQSPKGSSYNEEGNGIIFYQGRAEFGNRFPSIRLYTTEPTRIAEINSVLLSVRAPVGDINIAKNTCCIGRGLAAIKSKHGCNSFILYLLQSLKPLLEQYNGEGTVFGCINRKEIEGLPIIIPKESVINEFEEIVEKIDSEIKNLTIEQENLSALRDTLLPKLMAGEINVE